MSMRSFQPTKTQAAVPDETLAHDELRMLVTPQYCRPFPIRVVACQDVFTGHNQGGEP